MNLLNFFLGNTKLVVMKVNLKTQAGEAAGRDFEFFEAKREAKVLEEGNEKDLCVTGRCPVLANYYLVI